MELVIKRSKWLRGDEDSFLLRPTDGKMCCLGFHALACGLTEEQILSRYSPESLNNIPELPEFMRFLVVGKESKYYTQSHYLANTAVASQLMVLNDDEELPDVDREERIATIFAEHGVEVRFED